MNEVEGIPGKGAVVHKLKSCPECLSSGLSFGSDHVATEAGDQSDHADKARWFRGTFALAMSHLVLGLPFTRRQNDIATKIRTVATEAAQGHHTPCDHRVNRKTVFDTRQRFKLAFFRATTGIQSSKTDSEVAARIQDRALRPLLSAIEYHQLECREHGCVSGPAGDSDSENLIADRQDPTLTHTVSGAFKTSGTSITLSSTEALLTRLKVEHIYGDAARCCGRYVYCEADHQ